MTEHGIAYHLTAIAGHLREAGADWNGAVIELPEVQWLIVAHKIAAEIRGFKTYKVGGKYSTAREFLFHGIKYRSLG